MHYLLEGTLHNVNMEIIDIEEALLMLEQITHLQSGAAVRVLSEKLAALNTEKSKLEDDLN